MTLRLPLFFAGLAVGFLPFSASAQPPAVPRALSVDETEGVMVPLPPDSDTDTQLRIQIYLDERNFGPGNLDGRIGEFGKKAASVYNQINNIAVGNYGPLIERSAKAVPQPYTTYTIKEGDLVFVTPGMPGKPSLQAKTKYLGYTELMEFVSERFHTSEEFLMKINAGKNFNTLKPGSILKVPNVKPFEIENWAKYVQFKPEEPATSHAVVVDIKARVAIFFDDKNKPIASFPITPGQPKFIKFGEWKVTNMVSTPTFRWDKSMLEEGRRSSSFYELPIGPNNPVGIMWCGTSRSGIGLHGTNNPLTIGRAESHGCIRLANWDAVRLPTLLRPGSRVVIR
ncbi:MAG: L,D-transpeptidase family protein [Verrucomicrobiota bacterium]